MQTPAHPAPGSSPESLPPPAFLSKLPVALTPDRNLLTYYVLSSFLLGPAFLFVLIPRYFRFLTLRYDIDEEGIRMRWGILFRREVTLTYARVQDIHLASNVVERWLNLGRLQVQTASGSASAEMTIEGVRELEPLRDFIYGRMRGARSRGAGTGIRSGEGTELLQERSGDDLAVALAETAAEMRAIRALLERRLGTGGTP